MRHLVSKCSLLDGAFQHHSALIQAILLDDLAVVEHVELLSNGFPSFTGLVDFTISHGSLSGLRRFITETRDSLLRTMSDPPKHVLETNPEKGALQN